ncbi:MAG: hypothetical protein ACRDLL_13015 [Solirubrobacterales bacterium]
MKFPERRAYYAEHAHRMALELFAKRRKPSLRSARKMLEDKEALEREHAIDQAAQMIVERYRSLEEVEAQSDQSLKENQEALARVRKRQFQKERDRPKAAGESREAYESRLDRFDGEV